MNKFFSVLVFSILFFQLAKAQQVIHAHQDTSICTPGSSVILSATVDSGFNSGSIVSTVDDQYTGIINLGFTFNFFGNNYTQCLLSTNFYITFDLGGPGLFGAMEGAGGYSPWEIDLASSGAGGIPTPNNPTNSIMGPFHDTYVGAPGAPQPGVIAYGTFGTAPNRIFVLSMCEVPMFQCVTETFSGQIILHETTNIIEMQTLHKDVCATWNGGLAIEGIQNATGTIGFTVAGRNAQQWTCNNDAYSFTPTSATNYTIAPIPFQMVPFVAGTPVWTDLNGNIVDTGYSISVAPLVTTSYIVSTGSCGNASDTVTITVGTLPVTYNQLNASCPNSIDGAAFATPTGNTGPFNFVWQNAGGGTIQTTNGVSADSLFNLGAGTYTVFVTDSLGCTATHTFTITSGTLNATYNQINATCPSTANATLMATTGGSGNNNFVWTNSTGGVIQTTNNVQSDTLHNLLPGTYTITITSPFGCTTTHTFIVGSGNANASFTVSPAHICLGSTANFTNTSTTTNTSITNYNWSFGDGNSSNTQNTTHVYSAAGNYFVQLIITMNGGCTDTVTQQITIIPNISADFVSQPATEACIGQTIAFNDNSNQYPIGWNWTFGDGGTAVFQNPYHVYNTSGVFTVQLTATDSLCGISTISHTITVFDFPNPYIGPDTSICIDELLEFHANAIGQSYTWNTGAVTEAITVAPQTPQWYIVYVDNHGCVGVDSVYVDFNCDLFMPNAFSPNGNTTNDIFRPRGEKIVQFRLMIFNRWGQVIYNQLNTSVQQGWDGTFNGIPQEVGVYVYYIDAQFIKGHHIEMQGNVSLIR